MAEVITLQVLMEKFKFSSDQLKVEVSHEHLTKISHLIENHEILGPHLKLLPAEMANIKSTSTMASQKLSMLEMWKEKFSYDATYKVLIEACLECNKAKTATCVCQLLTQRK